MNLTRRAVLRGAGSVPVIFGLAAVGCRGGGRGDGPPPPGSPNRPPNVPRDKDGNPWYWASVVEAIERDRVAGIVLRVPSDRAVGIALGSNVVDLAARGSLDDRILFLEGVFVFLTDAEIARLVPEARDSDAVVLIDAKAHRLDGVALSAAQLSDRSEIDARLRGLVEGPKGFDLARVAAERRAATEKDGKEGRETKTFDELLTDTGRAYFLWPAVVLERRTTADAARRRALEETLRGALDSRILAPARMPYGVQMDSEGGGCGDAAKEEHVACGMAMPIPSSYRFLGYLTARPG